ncbi:MAG: hypothetical protein RLZZ60_1291 [Bacteroidota bacterium]|jgi:hypothetical protein
MQPFKLLILIAFLMQQSLNAQSLYQDTVIKRSRHLVKIGYEIEGTDTLPVYLFNRFNYNIESGQGAADQEALKKLNRWVRKALPYAKLAAFRLQTMEDNLSLMSSEREKKRYVKACEKAIKQQFMDDLKNMYVEEGRILLKLIHRETGSTTFEIMQNYGGTLETVFWQAVAKTYSANMKVTYDPIVDYQIEAIILAIEKENASK